MNFLTKLLDFNTKLEAQISGGRHGILRAGRQPAFAHRDECDTRIIIIDLSINMGASDYPPTRLEAAKDAAVEYVMTLAKQKTPSRIAVISFSDDAKIVVPLTDISCHQNIIRGIRSISISGCTDIGEGLKLAAKLLTILSCREYRIILLTDGYGDCPLRIPGQLKKEHGATIDVVGIGGSPKDVNERLLRKIATTDPDGTNHYRFIRDAETLKYHYRQLAAGLVRKGGVG